MANNEKPESLSLCLDHGLKVKGYEPYLKKPKKHFCYYVESCREKALLEYRLIKK